MSRDPTDIFLNKSDLIDSAQLEKVYGIILIVNPNPANQWTTLDYKMPTNESSGEIVNGGVVVSVFTNSIDGDVTSNLGLFDIWIYKLNESGDHLWSTFIGGSYLTELF